MPQIKPVTINPQRREAARHTLFCRFTDSQYEALCQLAKDAGGKSSQVGVATVVRYIVDGALRAGVTLMPIIEVEE